MKALFPYFSFFFSVLFKLCFAKTSCLFFCLNETETSKSTFAKTKKQSCKLSKSVNASFNNYKKASVMQISQLVNQTDRHCNKSVIQLLIDTHSLTKVVTNNMSKCLNFISHVFSELNGCSIWMSVFNRTLKRYMQEKLKEWMVQKN